MTAAETRRLRRAAAWDRRVFEDPLFWAIRPYAARLPEGGAMPAVEIVDAALAEHARIRFASATPRGRRGRRVSMYDTDIMEGAVPTREGSWHDLMNALVWAALPRSKRALHALQERYVAETRGTGRRLPAHDALAILDEGGALVCAPRPLAGEAEIDRALETGEARLLPFGHAIYESVAIGGPRPLVRARPVVVPAGAMEDDRALVDAADAALEAVIARGELARTPKDLPCITLARVFGDPRIPK